LYVSTGAQKIAARRPPEGLLKQSLKGIDVPRYERFNTASISAEEDAAAKAAAAK
jgi:hypothetical protein